MMSRFIRVASVALILAVPAFAAYSFVAAGQLPGTPTSGAPAMIQVGSNRAAIRTNDREATRSSVENVDLRDFSYTGRPVPSVFTVK
jgi:hypothetical protein